VTFPGNAPDVNEYVTVVPSGSDAETVVIGEYDPNASLIVAIVPALVTQTGSLSTVPALSRAPDNPLGFKTLIPKVWPPKKLTELALVAAVKEV
jgi:hypothetical protein